MSEENQKQSENQSQASSDNQTGASDENTAPKPQAVESSPKPRPEPSWGIEKFSKREAPSSRTFEKRDKKE